MNLIYGAGRGGEGMLDFLHPLPVAFIDDGPGQAGRQLRGIPVVCWEDRPPEADRVVIAVADRAARMRLARKCLVAGIRPMTLVEGPCGIALSALVDEGSYVKAGAVIGARVEIGALCIIDNNVTVCHHSKIGQAVHLAPGATLGGFVEVGHFAFVGTGAIVQTGSKIGCGAAIAAGSIVGGDVPDWAYYVGDKVIGKTKMHPELPLSEDEGFVASGGF